MNSDMISNKKLNQIVAELFTHHYFTLPKDVRLNCTHFFYYEN